MLANNNPNCGHRNPIQACHMSKVQALKPALYSVPDEGPSAAPQLHGGRCSCGYVFFPHQTYGCEKCGKTGDALSPALLPARGTLVASARVLMHARKDRQPPFVVVSVQLDDGPVVRTLLADDTDAVLPIGTPMLARLIEVGRAESGEPIVDLRFALASARAA
jgi:uncharacterized protein